MRKKRLVLRGISKGAKFIVVLIAVVAIFKTQLTKLVGELFTKLSENAKAI